MYAACRRCPRGIRGFSERNQWIEARHGGNLGPGCSTQARVLAVRVSGLAHEFASEGGATMLIAVHLIGPDQVRSHVLIDEDTTVRDVATSKYPLFWRTLKRNGSIVPLTGRVFPGDTVAVEDETVNES